MVSALPLQEDWLALSCQAASWSLGMLSARALKSTWSSLSRQPSKQAAAHLLQEFLGLRGACNVCRAAFEWADGADSFSMTPLSSLSIASR